MDIHTYTRIEGFCNDFIQGNRLRSQHLQGFFVFSPKNQRTPRLCMTTLQSILGKSIEKENKVTSRTIKLYPTAFFKLITIPPFISSILIFSTLSFPSDASPGRDSPTLLQNPFKKQTVFWPYKKRSIWPFPYLHHPYRMAITRNQKGRIPYDSDQKPKPDASNLLYWHDGCHYFCFILLPNSFYGNFTSFDQQLMRPGRTSFRTCRRIYGCRYRVISF